MCHDELENIKTHPKLNVKSKESQNNSLIMRTWSLEQDLFNKPACINFLGEPGDLFIGLPLKNLTT